MLFYPIIRLVWPEFWQKKFNPLKSWLYPVHIEDWLSRLIVVLQEFFQLVTKQNRSIKRKGKRVTRGLCIYASQRDHISNCVFIQILKLGSQGNIKESTFAIYIFSTPANFTSVCGEQTRSFAIIIQSFLWSHSKSAFCSCENWMHSKNIEKDFSVKTFYWTSFMKQGVEVTKEKSLKQKFIFTIFSWFQLSN